MDVILSIKPQFMAEIIKGRKTFEYRKNRFKRSVNKVYIYVSSPICRIVGEFILGEILEDQPEQIWNITCGHAGITKEYFDEYYKNRNVAYALEIKCFKLYKEPIDPYEVMEKFTPPQSFCYVHRELLDYLSASNLL